MAQQTYAPIAPQVVAAQQRLVALRQGQRITKAAGEPLSMVRQNEITFTQRHLEALLKEQDDRREQYHRAHPYTSRGRAPRDPEALELAQRLGLI